MSYERTHGITPACAGSRQINHATLQSSQDHPRVCGEQNAVSALLEVRSGSPPRVRGAVISLTFWAFFVGITPACAGSRQYLERDRIRVADHPRVCGEQYTKAWTARKMRGSPPRVRGAEMLYHKFIYAIRITPACAGSSHPCHHPRPCHPDHPRVCGEQCIKYATACYNRGSPPRVRGAGQHILLSWLCIRITPACAGSRLSINEGEKTAEDHPRVCGEQLGLSTIPWTMMGSPPRVRGAVGL